MYPNLYVLLKICCMIPTFSSLFLFLFFQIVTLFSKTVKYIRKVVSAPKKKKIHFDVQKFE